MNTGKIKTYLGVFLKPVGIILIPVLILALAILFLGVIFIYQTIEIQFLPKEIKEFISDYEGGNLRLIDSVYRYSFERGNHYSHEHKIKIDGEKIYSIGIDGWVDSAFNNFKIPPKLYYGVDLCGPRSSELLNREFNLSDTNIEISNFKRINIIRNKYGIPKMIQGCGEKKIFQTWFGDLYYKWDKDSIDYKKYTVIKKRFKISKDWILIRII